MKEENNNEIVDDSKESYESNFTEKKKEKSSNYKYIIISSLFVVLIAIGFWFLFLKGKVSDEELAKEFTITSIESKTKGNYISNNETFVIKTSTANEEILRTHLYVEPAVNYEIKKVNSKEYEVSLENAPSDTIVNLSFVKDEVKSYSWAFQTTKDLKVLSVYPADGSASVSTDTGIVVVLSYPNVQNFEEHFEISPKVEGTFTSNGRTWRFIPKEPLKDKTTYTVTISSGLSIDGNVLQESYKSSFSTYNRPVNESTYTDTVGKRAYHSSISVDHINTFTPNEKITFKMYYTPSSISKIKMYKFNSYNDFMKFMNNEKNYDTNDLGEQSFTRNSTNFTYILDNTFDEGYYVEEVYLSTGELYATIPVQINKLSAFLLASNFDILTWVGSENSLLKGINVSYEGKSIKTDENGLAVIKNYYSENEDGIKYVNVGNNKNPLVIGVNSYNYFDYPNGYIYTDRPLYKNNDTINVWGYIPLKFYQELDSNFKKEDFILSVNNEKIPITISEDGTFNAKYIVDNYMDSYIDIYIKYKNTYVASRYVEVKNYTKQNYEYSIDYEKNYVKAGDNFNFTVHVKHVTGIDVQNKTIVVEYNNKKYTKVTDSSGNATFSLPTEKGVYNNGEPEAFSSDSTFDYQYVNINTGDSDYNENDYSITFYKVLYYVDVNDYKYDAKDETITMTADILSLENKTNYIDWTNINEALVDGKYNGNVDIYLFERRTNRVFSHEYYNQYTEQKEKVYDYVTEYEKKVDTDSINIKDGKINYKVKYALKESTDDTEYSYSIIFVFKDKAGNLYHYNGYLYKYSPNSVYYSMIGHYSEYYDYYGEDYAYYRYYFAESDKYKYSVDDEISLLLKSFDNSIIENAKVLRISLKDSIIESKIFNVDENMNSVFNKSDIPGVTYAGALFKDGKFYRLPATYYDYNEEDSRLNIEISLDKTSYKPKEEVTVKIKTKDKNNNSVKAKVNLSVVDKAVFNVVQDETRFLESVYSNRILKAYLYSSYRDYSLGNNGGGRGDTGDGTRNNFGDTVFFKEIETNDDGEAEVKFTLNDSVTTFVLTALAANSDVLLGESKKEIVSTLPLAISVIEPTGLKTSDDIVISANSVGSVKTDVNYTFTLKGLDKKIEKTGKIGATVYANFGKLEEGNYTIIINATSGDAKDSIEFPFTVKTTQQEISVKATSRIDNLKTIKPLKNPIVLEFYKDGFGTYMRYLDIMLETNQDRIDTRIAYYKALELENKYYGYDYPIHINDMNKFNKNGMLRYLENDTPSAVVTALVNYYYPNIYKLNASDFYNILDTTDFTKEAVDQLLVLASMKEPVLDQLKYASKIGGVDDEITAEIVLSYLFLGDYNSAKELYNKISDSTDIDGLLAIISTFIDKNNASKKIYDLYTKDNADRYVFFAMMSYFANNEANLSEESTITIKYSDKTETVKIKGLMMKKITISNKDLDTLSMTSDDKNDMVNYYYEGGISEVSEDNIKRNITLSIDSNNLLIGKTTNLKLNISSLKGVYGNVKVYLPNSMRFSGEIVGKGAYLSANKGEYLVIYLSKDHGDVIQIPVYLSYPGNYKVEEVILKNKDNYYISNSLDVNIK